MSRQKTIRVLMSLLLPGGVLVLAAWALQQEEVVREAAAPYAVYFCFGAAAAAVLLSWYYEQSRLLCSSAAVLLSASAFQQFPDHPHVMKLVAVLLPLNLALFAASRERGVLTVKGLLQIGLVAGQAMVVSWLAPQHVPELEAWLSFPERAGASSSLAVPALVSFAIVTVALVSLAVTRGTKVEQGLLWTSVACFLGLNSAGQDQGQFIYFGGAGLVLVLAVLEHGYDIAYRDELTGLPGRRAFNNAAGHLGGAYAIAMCDVDHFKQLNDTYGHETGDELLRMVAAKLSQVGGGGRAFRYGGEEFLVIFRGRTAKEAEPFVENLRKAVAGIRLTRRGADRPARTNGTPVEAGRDVASIGISVSIGIGEKSIRHSTPELVVEAADTALYRAKEAGRNCVRIAEGIPA
jgi:diguanylate cyclase (GGDEF)-like protein